MAQRGKSLSFEAPEIEDLLHIEYGDRRLFPLLSLLFPFVDLRNQFHVDHIHPGTRRVRRRTGRHARGRHVRGLGRTARHRGDVA